MNVVRKPCTGRTVMLDATAVAVLDGTEVFSSRIEAGVLHQGDAKGALHDGEATDLRDAEQVCLECLEELMVGKGYSRTQLSVDLGCAATALAARHELRTPVSGMGLDEVVELLTSVEEKRSATRHKLTDEAARELTVGYDALLGRVRRELAGPLRADLARRSANLLVEALVESVTFGLGLEDGVAEQLAETRARVMGDTRWVLLDTRNRWGSSGFDAAMVRAWVIDGSDVVLAPAPVAAYLLTGRRVSTSVVLSTCPGSEQVETMLRLMRDGGAFSEIGAAWAAAVALSGE